MYFILLHNNYKLRLTTVHVTPLKVNCLLQIMNCFLFTIYTVLISHYSIYLIYCQLISSVFGIFTAMRIADSLNFLKATQYWFM